MRVGLKLLLASALAIGAGTAGAVEVALPPFYQSVMAMKPEGRLGAVIAREAVDTAIPNAQAWRIAYVSSDLLERPTISTALVIAPAGPVPAAGRPIVSWAHGTTGTAQNCGPSQQWDPAQPLNQYFLIGGTSDSDFGIPAAEEFLAKGYVLVATDYQGLGGGGKHQYAISATQGRDAINAIRAASSLGLAGTNRKAAVYGWSQGGGATLSAAGMADYIARTGTAFDGIDIVGFAAMAPQDVAVLAPQGELDDAAAAKLMSGLETSFTANVFDFTHFAMTIWATAAAFPDLKLTDIFTADGARSLDEIFSGKCMHPASDTINFTFGAGFKSLLSATPANQLAWAKSILLGSVLPAAPVAPVIIYWGTHDTVVPPVMGELYREQMCKLAGVNITRVQLEGAQNHFTTPAAAQPLYVPWIVDRLEGKPLPDGCDAN
jgi:pimeloyl-ACP methyl ester carboxylesterase